METANENNKTNYRQAWMMQNKDRLAEYARKQYHKKVEENPEYRKVLVERTLERRRRLKAEQEPKPKGRPKKEQPPKKPPGRPRKYI